jgi:hypothetical protein
MAVIWPPSLVEELADRRCILVLGAGASASCVGNGGTRPPLWRSFLVTAINELVPNADTKIIAVDLLDKERFLDCAEVIIEAANKADFARFIRRTFVQPRFKPCNIHELVLTLDPKVVITTNYDEIYDHYCRDGEAKDGYNVCKYYEDHALNALRSPERLILKAHGCVSDPDKIILSRSQYFNARRLHVQFYNILDGLFLVNTALFVGCSLVDPDLQLILENVNLSAHSSHPHYALIEAGTSPAVCSSFKRTYNVQLLEYDVGHHEQVPAALAELSELVLDRRQRPS